MKRSLTVLACLAALAGCSAAPATTPATPLPTRDQAGYLQDLSSLRQRAGSTAGPSDENVIALGDALCTVAKVSKDQADYRAKRDAAAKNAGLPSEVSQADVERVSTAALKRLCPEQAARLGV